MLAARVEQKNGPDRTETPCADAQRDHHDLFQPPALDHNTISSPTSKRQSGASANDHDPWNQ
jgi:hypothetical protein